MKNLKNFFISLSIMFLFVGCNELPLQNKISWSPNSKNFIFVDETGKAIWLINTQDNQIEKIIQSDNFIYNPQFFPDGNSILYEETNFLHPSFSGIYHSSSDSKNKKEFNIDNPFKTQLIRYKLKSRSKEILFEDIFLDETIYNDSYDFFPPLYNASFNKRKNQIAFNKYVKGKTSIYTYNLQTEEKIPLFEDESFTLNPVWSEDGTKLAYIKLSESLLKHSISKKENLVLPLIIEDFVKNESTMELIYSGLSFQDTIKYTNKNFITWVSSFLTTQLNIPTYYFNEKGKLNFKLGKISLNPLFTPFFSISQKEITSIMEKTLGEFNYLISIYNDDRFSFSLMEKKIYSQLTGESVIEYYILWNDMKMLAKKLLPVPSYLKKYFSNLSIIMNNYISPDGTKIIFTHLGLPLLIDIDNEFFTFYPTTDYQKYSIAIFLSKENPQEAIKYLNDIKLQNNLPNTFKAKILQSALLNRINKKEEAKKIIKNLQEFLKTNGMPPQQICLEFIKINLPEMCEEEIQELEYIPDKTMVLNEYTKFLIQKKDYKKAIYYLNELKNICKESSLEENVIYLLADIYFQTSNFNKAEEYLNLYEANYKNGADIDKVYLLKGYVNQKKGNNKEAIKYFRKIDKYELSGEILFNEKKYKLALNDFIKSNNKNGIAKAYNALGNWKKAISIYEEQNEFEKIGDIYFSKKFFKKARQFYYKSLRTNDSKEKQQETLLKIGKTFFVERDYDAVFDTLNRINKTMLNENSKQVFEKMSKLIKEKIKFTK